MEKLTVKVADLRDWDLILVTNWYGLENSLNQPARREVMEAAWAHQDGYGEPGYTPPQGWDWSGIRDSSDAAQVNMAQAIKHVLKVRNITEIEVSWDPAQVSWKPGEE